MSTLLNIPTNDPCGVYTITNQRTGRKYIGSSFELKTRAIVHKREIEREKHHNRLIQEDIEKDDIFIFNIVKIIDDCSCWSYQELKTKIRIEEYTMIKKAVLKKENLYNLESMKQINSRLEGLEKELSKIAKRKSEIDKMMTFQNDKLLFAYKYDVRENCELKLLEKEILKRMNNCN